MEVGKDPIYILRLYHGVPIMPTYQINSIRQLGLRQEVGDENFYNINIVLFAQCMR
jgi:hypothetical protein